MFGLKKILLSTITVFAFSEVAQSSILGHSGVVFHVDKYGHISGHSSHYDYRVFPEKVYLPLPLIDHHNIVGHHHELDDDHQEAFNLIEEEYHHKVHPIFYYAHHIDHENHHIDHDSHHLDHANHHLDHEDHHSYHHLHHL